MPNLAKSRNFPVMWIPVRVSRLEHPSCSFVTRLIFWIFLVSVHFSRRWLWDLVRSWYARWRSRHWGTWWRRCGWSWWGCPWRGALAWWVLGWWVLGCGVLGWRVLLWRLPLGWVCWGWAVLLSRGRIPGATRVALVCGGSIGRRHGSTWSSLKTRVVVGSSGSRCHHHSICKETHELMINTLSPL